MPQTGTEARRVLVVSPHFPPTDAVDMHRVRMTVGHYRQHGWEPVVLCVRPQDAGRLIDERLVRTVPEDVEVVRVAAPPPGPGLRAVGLRAWRPLMAAGARVLAGRRFDLVFISTTAFPAMALGRVWKRRFGVPFVLDFQDPWATFPSSAEARPGLRHGLMRALHRLGEGWTLPAADGLMAVSQTYVDLLQTAYPVLRDRPSLVSPFGFSQQDFAVAKELGRPLPLAWKAPGSAACLFAGVVAPGLERSLLALFRIVARGRVLRPILFEQLGLAFVGTGYASQGNRSVAGRLAAEAGIADLVVEHPDRAPLLDVLRAMGEADALLLLGSDDHGYTPSKTNQTLAAGRPVLCAAPARSPVAAAVAGLESVLSLDADAPLTDEAVIAWADRLEPLLAGKTSTAAAIDRAASFEAAACAARDCALFDRVSDGR
ncbi:MAG TPA: glycosyltransferase [Caulobacter sp.]|nr:glycosyltransferase [Caulobacter sp.]